MSSDTDRRAVLQAGLAATFAMAGSFAAAQPKTSVLDGDTREWLKLVADLSGRTVMSVTEGIVWGFLPQADDLTVETFARRLYGYRSLGSRTARLRDDGSVTLTTQGWSFYTDAKSGEVVTSLTNPYTGMQVSCPPLSGPPSTAVFGAAGGQPLDLRRRRLGQHLFVDIARISRFKPSDTTWFKLEADLTTYSCRAADADAPNHIPSTWSHNLVAEWQTWMKMHGAPGHILFKGEGAPLREGADLPPALYDAVGRYFPGSLSSLTDWRKGAHR